MRRTDGTIEVRPIAGTRPRGASSDEDRRLEEELRADEKERAEHVMLVDLGRNDIGRVSEFGSVETNEYMIVERYSQVMHLVSNVRGRVSGDLAPLDVVRATFPAGTVSGAPKVRAMEIIESLEPVRRRRGRAMCSSSGSGAPASWQHCWPTRRPCCAAWSTPTAAQNAARSTRPQRCQWSSGRSAS